LTSGKKTLTDGERFLGDRSIFPVNFVKKMNAQRDRGESKEELRASTTSNKPQTGSGSFQNILHSSITP
jgi:hypothetical protein